MMVTEFKVAKLRTGGEQDDGSSVIIYGKVLSDTSENEYNVVKYSDGTYRCTCIGNLYHRNTHCKHILFFQEEERRMMLSEPKATFWVRKWCQCINGRSAKAEPVYFEDEACSCGLLKHHYHCKHCGGLVQVG